MSIADVVISMGFGGVGYGVLGVPLSLLGIPCHREMVKRVPPSRPLVRHPQYRRLAALIGVTQVSLLALACIVSVLGTQRMSEWLEGTSTQRAMTWASPALAFGVGVVGLVVFLGPVLVLGLRYSRSIRSDVRWPAAGAAEVRALWVYVMASSAVIVILVGLAVALLAAG